MGFKHIDDPNHEIFALCINNVWLSLFGNQRQGDFLADTLGWTLQPKATFSPLYLREVGIGGCYITGAADQAGDNVNAEVQGHGQAGLE